MDFSKNLNFKFSWGQFSLRLEQGKFAALNSSAKTLVMSCHVDVKNMNIALFSAVT